MYITQRPSNHKPKARFVAMNR